MEVTKIIKYRGPTPSAKCMSFWQGYGEYDTRYVHVWSERGIHLDVWWMDLDSMEGYKRVYTIHVEIFDIPLYEVESIWDGLRVVKKFNQDK